MPYSDNQIKYVALAGIENEIIGLTKILSDDKIIQIVNLWYNGLIRQVTNFPPDIMIEKWIFDQYPTLRSLQLESIKKQHAEATTSLTESVREITPPTILFASNIMNYVFFRIIGFHIGFNFIKQYSSTPYINKGKELA